MKRRWNPKNKSEVTPEPDDNEKEAESAKQTVDTPARDDEEESIESSNPNGCDVTTMKKLLMWYYECGYACMTLSELLYPLYPSS